MRPLPLRRKCPFTSLSEALRGTTHDTPCGADRVIVDGHWLSTTEAARRLGVKQQTLYGYINTGGLTAYRFGRVIRIKDVDLAAYIESGRIVPGTLRTRCDSTRL